MKKKNEKITAENEFVNKKKKKREYKRKRKKRSFHFQETAPCSGNDMKKTLTRDNN